MVLGGIAAAPRARADVPAADHIFVIIMENKTYDEVRTLPYTASLISSSSSFAWSYALTHPSQPNYMALWSGGTQGVTDDQCPPPGAPFTAENLGHACEAAGIPWRAYSENLPAPAYNGCSADGNLYVRRHCVWTHFSNLDHSRERPYQDLATDITAGTLPALAFVIPNQCDNTHDCPAGNGDAWLSQNVPAMLAAAGPNGFLVLTWDEDDGTAGNHILTVFAGGLVRSGYVSQRGITHYTVLRTICDALGITPFGSAAGQTPITDVWNAAGIPYQPVASGLSTLRLGPVFPNPSTGVVEAVLRVGGNRPASAAIYNAAGRLVARLLDGCSPGTVLLRWDGRETDGRAAAAGVYFLRARAGNDSSVSRVVLID
jgi:hypothetical protein